MLIKFQLLMKDNNIQNTWWFSLPWNLSSYTHRKGRICSVPLRKTKATWKHCRVLKGKCLNLAHCSKNLSSSALVNWYNRIFPPLSWKSCTMSKVVLIANKGNVFSSASLLSGDFRARRALPWNPSILTVFHVFLSPYL